MEVVSFRPRPLCPWERTPDTHWIEGWVGPRADMDAVQKRNTPFTALAGNITAVVQRMTYSEY